MRGWQESPAAHIEGREEGQRGESVAVSGGPARVEAVRGGAGSERTESGGALAGEGSPAGSSAQVEQRACTSHGEWGCGVVGEWAFSQTSHGKGPWDGEAATVKHAAYREALNPNGMPLQTAREFATWGNAKMATPKENPFGPKQRVWGFNGRFFWLVGPRMGEGDNVAIGDVERVSELEAQTVKGSRTHFSFHTSGGPGELKVRWSRTCSILLGFYF